MMCVDLFITLAKDHGAWLVAWVVMAPFAVWIGTAVYYRSRYRAGIASQQHFDRGLFNHDK